VGIFVKYLHFGQYCLSVEWSHSKNGVLVSRFPVNWFGQQFYGQQFLVNRSWSTVSWFNFEQPSIWTNRQF